MDIQRELVYTDRPSLKAFGIDTKGSYNQILYDKWLLSRIDLKPSEPGLKKRYLKVFNDAYFVCTLALMHDPNVDWVSYCIERIEYPSVVMPMAYFYLSKLKKVELSTSTALQRTLTLIEASAKEKGWEENLVEIKSLGEFKKRNIDDTTFIPCFLTSELLSSANWLKITNRYDEKAIKWYFMYIAKSDEEREMMAKAIRESVCDYEDEMSKDGYVDENGDWVVTTHDFSSVKSLCDSVESSPKLYDLTKLSTETASLNINAPKINLQRFLAEGWFVGFSTNPDKYTLQWRNQMVEDLMQTEYGVEIAKLWHEKINGKSKATTIKLALVGVLRDVGVLRGKKKDIVTTIGLHGFKTETLSDYMAKKEYKPYTEWLREYINREYFPIESSD